MAIAPLTKWRKLLELAAVITIIFLERSCSAFVQEARLACRAFVKRIRVCSNPSAFS
jgi:hypothetical protein